MEKCIMLLKDFLETEVKQEHARHMCVDHKEKSFCEESAFLFKELYEKNKKLNEC